jgi:hypothetical protein
MAATAGQINIGPYGKIFKCIKQKFVEDFPMIIPAQFGFNCSSGFRKEAF